MQATKPYDLLIELAEVARQSNKRNAGHEFAHAPHDILARPAETPDCVTATSAA